MPKSVVHVYITIGQRKEKLLLATIKQREKNQVLSKSRVVFKGIVSRDFDTLFLISLDRIEGRYRAGSGLFFILMTFSCLNLIIIINK
jgi:hypothetical protein